MFKKIKFSVDVRMIVLFFGICFLFCIRVRISLRIEIVRVCCFLMFLDWINLVIFFCFFLLVLKNLDVFNVG